MSHVVMIGRWLWWLLIQTPIMMIECDSCHKHTWHFLSHQTCYSWMTCHPDPVSFCYIHSVFLVFLQGWGHWQAEMWYQQAQHSLQLSWSPAAAAREILTSLQAAAREILTSLQAATREILTSLPCVPTKHYHIMLHCYLIFLKVFSNAFEFMESWCWQV